MPQSSEGQALYMENCVQCHGVSGKGDGPWASAYDPRPADLTRLDRNGKFPTAHVLSVIDGYERAACPLYPSPSPRDRQTPRLPPTA